MGCWCSSLPDYNHPRADPCLRGAEPASPFTCTAGIQAAAASSASVATANPKSLHFVDPNLLLTLRSQRDLFDPSSNVDSCSIAKDTSAQTGGLPSGRFSSRNHHTAASFLSQQPLLVTNTTRPRNADGDPLDEAASEEGDDDDDGGSEFRRGVGTLDSDSGDDGGVANSADGDGGGLRTTAQHLLDSVVPLMLMLRPSLEAPARRSAYEVRHGQPSSAAAVQAGAAAAAAVVPSVALSSRSGSEGGNGVTRRPTLTPGLTRDSFLLNNTTGGGTTCSGYMLRTATCRADLLQTDANWPPFKMGNPLHVKIGDLLGRGGCGSVYKGEWCGRPVAVKVVQQVVMTPAAAGGAKSCSECALAPVLPLIDFLGSSNGLNTLKYKGAVGGGVDTAAAIAAAAAAAAAATGGTAAPYLPDAHASVKRLRHPNVLRTYAYAALSTAPQFGGLLPARHEHHVVLELCDGGSLRGWLDRLYRGGQEADGTLTLGSVAAAKCADAAVGTPSAAAKRAIERAQAHIVTCGGGFRAKAGSGANEGGGGQWGHTAGMSRSPPWMQTQMQHHQLQSQLQQQQQQLQDSSGQQRWHPGAFTAGVFAAEQSPVVWDAAAGRMRPITDTGVAAAAAVVEAAVPTAAAPPDSSTGGQSQSASGAVPRRLPGLTQVQSEQLKLLGMTWVSDSQGRGHGHTAAAGGLATGASADGLSGMRGGGTLMDGGAWLEMGGDAGEGSCLTMSAMSEPSLGRLESKDTAAASTGWRAEVLDSGTVGAVGAHGKTDGSRTASGAAARGRRNGSLGVLALAAAFAPARGGTACEGGASLAGVVRSREGGGGGGGDCSVALSGPPSSTRWSAAVAAAVVATADRCGVAEAPPAAPSPPSAALAAAWAGSSLHLYGNGSIGSVGACTAVRQGSSSVGVAVHHHFVILGDVDDDNDDGADVYGDAYDGSSVARTAGHSAMMPFGDLRMDEPLRQLVEGSMEGQQSSISRGDATAATNVTAITNTTTATAGGDPSSHLRRPHAATLGSSAGGGGSSATSAISNSGSRAMSAWTAVAAAAGHAAGAMETPPAPSPDATALEALPLSPPTQLGLFLGSSNREVRAGPSPLGPSTAPKHAAAAAVADLSAAGTVVHTSAHHAKPLPAAQAEFNASAMTSVLNRRAVGMVRSILRAAAASGAGGGTPAGEPMQIAQLQHLVAALECLAEVAAGLSYLHGVGMVHGDVKSGNVLLKLDSRQPRGFVLKLADFGFSRVLENGSHAYLSRPSGTLAYLSPEMITAYRQSSASDQYAFGLLVWEVVTTQPLFRGMKTPQLLYAKTHNADWQYLKWPAWCPHEVQALARRCSEYDPSARLTAAQARAQLEYMRLNYQEQLLRASGGGDGCDEGSSGSGGHRGAAASGRIGGYEAASGDDGSGGARAIARRGRTTFVTARERRQRNKTI